MSANCILDVGKRETDKQRRQELGDGLIDLIRFPIMTLVEFTDAVASGNVLNKDELLSIYGSIAKQENASKFKNKPRLGLTITKGLFVRCVNMETDWTYDGAQDGLSFKVSKDCELSSVDMILPVSEISVTGVFELFEGTAVVHTKNVTCHYNKCNTSVLVCI
ncbi:hypothetical protein DPMN_146213 [Dreissena polymorpha]|uniref:Uncharacterized protein n=1 Tax=Dreissena polymorpha TaxID=45954 RepID=A0A9D4F5F9_DREPO|nr:hypothetical protein DPMN_146213 [Dreissena polymorpha]